MTNMVFPYQGLRILKIETRKTTPKRHARHLFFVMFENGLLSGPFDDVQDAWKQIDEIWEEASLDDLEFCYHSKDRPSQNPY